MGFSNTTTNMSITAKLTPFGRQELLKNSSSTITHFALGDSDAYYGTKDPLQSGSIPDISGNLSTINSTADGYKPKSLLYVDGLGNRKKSVQIGSNNVINSKKNVGYNTVTGSNLTYNLVNLNNYDIDYRVNWFYSFRLPISDTDKAIFSTTTSKNGGYSDTAYSGLSQEEILVIGIPANKYAEMLDGKSINIKITGNTGSYDIYSTYENTLTNNKKMCAMNKETSYNSAIFGDNIAFLFSDDIQRPNNDPTKTWSTKYGTTKAFSNGKPKFNYKTDINTAKVADVPVGIVYLDKGLIVITDPTIVSDNVGATNNATVRFDSVTTQITQEITCVADRGEFANSTNPTYSEGDTTRISEILLLDSKDNIMAVAKPDRHIEKTAQQFLALGIKITV